MDNQKTIKGTVEKMLVGFRYPADTSITLDDIDWYTEWFCDSYNSRRLLKLDKGQHQREVEGDIVNYYAYVDTSITGTGKLLMRLCAFIPDQFLEEGVRKEYAEIGTNEKIY